MKDQRGQTPADVLAKQKRAAVVSWLVAVFFAMQKCDFIKVLFMFQVLTTHRERFQWGKK